MMSLPVGLKIPKGETTVSIYWDNMSQRYGVITKTQETVKIYLWDGISVDPEVIHAYCLVK